VPIRNVAFLIDTLCARFDLSDSLLTETFVVNSPLACADRQNGRDFMESIVGHQARRAGAMVHGNAREKKVASEGRGHRRR
jgi:hypothetical protein